MVGKRIVAYDDNRNSIIGNVVFVYNDLHLSGINEYVSYTWLLVEDDNNNVIKIRPRDVVSIIYVPHIDPNLPIKI